VLLKFHLRDISVLRKEKTYIKIEAGRAVAQAVSRWLPTVAARAQVRAEHVGFVVDKVALG
jgi:hypothetical protein